MRVSIKTLLAACVCLAVGSAFALEAKVTSVTGKVQAQKAGSSEWIDVQKNDVLDAGTLISTGFNSNVTINLGDSVCTVAPLTRMSIEQLSQKNVGDGSDKTVTKTTVYIDSGKASFKVNSTSKSLNDFKVHSPASTASVRGTEFVVYSDGEVATQKGLVGVSSGVERNAISRSDVYFVSDGKAINAFTTTKDVGGGSIPIFKGQRVIIDAVTSVSSLPELQRTLDAVALPGDAVSLTDKQVRNETTAMYGSSSNNDVWLEESISSGTAIVDPAGASTAKGMMTITIQ